MPQLAGILMLVTQDLYPPVLGTAVSSTGHGVESIAPIVRCPGPSAHHSPVVPASAHIVTLSTRCHPLSTLPRLLGGHCHQSIIAPIWSPEVGGVDV